MENETDNAKIGAYLKEKRLAAGWSAEELSRKMDVSSYEVNAWETGFPPEVRYLLPLAEALGVSVEEILRGEDAPKESQIPSAPSEPTPLPSVGKTPPPAHAEAKPPEAKPASAPASSYKRKKQEKSYYETLHENMKTTDETGKPYETKDYNGFSSGERKFGYILCSIFIVLVLVIQIVGAVSAHNRYVRRDRTVTLENYTEYISVSVTGVGNFNVDEYDVSVTALKKITDFEIAIEAKFSGEFMGKGEETKTVNFHEKELKAGTTLTERVKLESFYFIQSYYKVLSVSGGLE